ncbi:MAG: F0F1 ATP synthase subunit B [Planctomycetota bacterium]
MMQRWMVLVAFVVSACAWTPVAAAGVGSAAGSDSGAVESEAVSSPAPAAAADEKGGKAASPLAGVKQGFASGITALIVFVLVAAFLARGVWPKIAGALDERQQKILDEIDGAEAARQQAKDALDQYEASLAEARSEAQQMLEQTKADQQKLAAELKAKSEAELQSLKEKAQRDIETARKAAVSEIYAHAADLATAVAGKILAREVSADDRQKLVDEAVAELGSSQGASNN